MQDISLNKDAVVKMLNKVPEVTIFFWIIKVLATTVGETAADYLSETLGLGTLKTTYFTGALLAITLIFQLCARKYIPGIYWLTVVIISVFGTLISDYFVDVRGVSLWVTTSIFTIGMVAVFSIWYAQEKTLSIHSIDTRKREAFYWLAILFTFALGTSAGDLIAEKLNLGYGKSIFLFAGLIAIVSFTHFILKLLNGVLTFWIAYVLTRPLGASIGDFMSQPKSNGGLGLGTTETSFIFLGAILIIVVFLSITKVDEISSVDAASTI